MQKLSTEDCQAPVVMQFFSLSHFRVKFSFQKQETCPIFSKKFFFFIFQKILLCSFSGCVVYEDILGDICEGIPGDICESILGEMFEEILGDICEDIPGGICEGIFGDTCEDILGDICAGIIGDICEEISGGICEDILGDICEDILGDICEDIPGDICEGILSDVCEDILGDVCEDILGDICEDILGDICEDILGDIGEDILGDINVLCLLSRSKSFLILCIYYNNVFEKFCFVAFFDDRTFLLRFETSKLQYLWPALDSTNASERMMSLLQTFGTAQPSFHRLAASCDSSSLMYLKIWYSAMRGKMQHAMHRHVHIDSWHAHASGSTTPTVGEQVLKIMKKCKGEWTPTITLIPTSGSSPPVTQQKRNKGNKMQHKEGVSREWKQYIEIENSHGQDTTSPSDNTCTYLLQFCDFTD